MTRDREEVFAALGDEADKLEDSLSAVTGMTAAFNSHLKQLNTSLSETGGKTSQTERTLSRGLGKALEGVAFDGVKLSDAMQGLALSLARTTFSAATKPVTQAIGSTIASGVGNIFAGMMPFADGGSFAQGRVMPFANGGVVSSPTTFPMRGGTGLMGEAGPEAIMPLTRTPDGKLGVRAAGGGGGGAAPVRVVMNIQTPDADSFRRSQGQIAASMSRALSRGNRNR